jgi:hypothetical protein
VAARSEIPALIAKVTLGGFGMQLSTEDATAWLDDPEPTLIVVGSGISLAAPTSAPSVYPFIERTTQQLEAQANYTPQDTMPGSLLT